MGGILDIFNRAKYNDFSFFPILAVKSYSFVHLNCSDYGIIIKLRPLIDEQDNEAHK